MQQNDTPDHQGNRRKHQFHNTQSHRLRRGTLLQILPALGSTTRNDNRSTRARNALGLGGGARGGQREGVVGVRDRGVVC